MRGSLVLLVAVSISMSSAACAVRESLPLPECSGLGSHLIVAQSVPSASQVPCFAFVPDGWSVDFVEIGNEGTVIALDSDRAGPRAAVLRFRRACETEGAIELASEHPETQRFDVVHRLAPAFGSTRLYTFEGGCVSWDFDFEADASATEAVVLGDALRLEPRTVLADRLRSNFVDEEL